MEEDMISAEEIRLTSGTSRMFIYEIREIPNLGMHSNPAILSGAMFL